MKKNSRIKGSTLLLTVIIALVLGILCCSMVLVAYYNRQQQFNGEIRGRLAVNLGSSINLVLADTVITSVEQTDTMDLYGMGQDSVAITKKGWGIFNVASITAFHQAYTARKNFIYGAPLAGYMNGCIYLADHQRPLLLIGDTRLTGDAWLSKAGIKEGIIDQRGYSHDQLIAGNVRQSETALPALNSMIADHLYHFAVHSSEPAQESIPAPLMPGDSLSRSFGDNAWQITVKGHLKLENISLQGNMIIRADSSIEVWPDVRLQHVILVAPYIRFRAGAHNTVQAIATDSLILEQDCVFNYPSALILVKDTQALFQNRISVAEGCRFSGIIMAYCPKKEDVQRSMTTIKAPSKIVGVLYCMGYLTPAGEIDGVVLTDYFIYRTSVAIYENHLVDVTINRTRLSRYFIAPPIFHSSSNQQIVEWVN